jgi:hypothetical protein
VATECVWAWSTTAANNSNSDAGIGWAELQLPSSVNNSARGMMAAIAKMRNDQGGERTLAGGTTAYTLTTNQVLGSLANGVRVHAKVNATNTGASTLNVDTLGAKAIRKVVTITGEVALSAGDLVTNQHAIFEYDTAANSAAGAWILLNPANLGSGGFTAKSADYTVTVADLGGLFPVSASAADRTVTLVSAVTAGNGADVWVIKSDTTGNSVTVTSAVAGQLLDYPGPRFTITNIEDNGSGFCRVTFADSQRVLYTGYKLRIASVVGTITGINADHTMTFVSGDGLSSEQVDLDLAFTGAYTSGGTCDYIATSHELRVAGDYVHYKSDGTQWVAIDSSPSVFRGPPRDWVFGRSLSYAGYQGNGNTYNRINGLIDGNTGFAWHEGLILAQRNDPPDLKLRRFRGENPTGTTTGVLQGESLGAIYWQGSNQNGNVQGFSGSIACRAGVDIRSDVPNEGGSVFISATADGDSQPSRTGLQVHMDQSVWLAGGHEEGSLHVVPVVGCDAWIDITGTSDTSGATVAAASDSANLNLWLSAKGTGTVIVNKPVVFQSYTVAQANALTATAGATIYVSNETGGGTLAYGNGTNWLRVKDAAIIS